MNNNKNYKGQHAYHWIIIGNGDLDYDIFGNVDFKYFFKKTQHTVLPYQYNKTTSQKNWFLRYIVRGVNGIHL